MNPDGSVAPILRLAVNSIYALGASSSILVGAYVLFIIAAALRIAPDLMVMFAPFWLVFIVFCITFLSFMMRLLYSKRWQKKRYSVWRSLLALLGTCALWGTVFVVFSLRGP